MISHHLTYYFILIQVHSSKILKYLQNPVLGSSTMWLQIRDSLFVIVFNNVALKLMNLEMQIPWEGFSMLGTYIVSALDHTVQIHNL